ncbi:MAG TPA: BON domain-containing protein [Myxococcota bacterium]|nr:BON domain-containing protein [Myxococcota bacterium]
MSTHSSRLVRTTVFAASLLLFTPAYAEQPEDAWLTTKAKTVLLTDGLVNGLAIRVDTFDAYVTLHGKVSSQAEKAQAERLVREIDGVADVRNLLAVVPREAREATRIADDAVRGAVRKALKDERALAHSSIRVKSVNEGVVVLSGEASTLSAHRRAIARARGVDGVRRVASEIQSPNELADREIWQGDDLSDGSGNGFSDGWITTKAKLSLMADPGISPMRVNVDTEDGVVTLFGTVATAADRARAAHEVKKIDGVKAVENELQVVADVAAAGVSESDDRVTAAVRKRIGERDSLSDADLDVATENGVVRLTGSVASQRDRLTALTVARSTRGVRSVIDDLQLRGKGM